MQQIDYSPDIVERIDLLSRKAIEKKRVLQDFIGIMQDRANLEDYYSRNLEKISESLTRLIHGKDQLKDIFLIMRNFVSIQAEQSRGLARSIKNEVATELQTLLNNEGNWQKDTQYLAKRHARDVRSYIDKLNQFRQEYIYSVQEEVRFQQNAAYKQKFPKSKIQCETQLRGYIDLYNKYIEQYFSDFAAVQDTFTNLEVDRRIAAQDTAMKYIMFEVSVVRNLQYDLNGISQKLEAYNPRNDLSELFKEQSNDKPLLCKLNFLNYQNFLHQQLNYNPNYKAPQKEPQKTQEVQEQQLQEQQSQQTKNKLFNIPAAPSELRKKRPIFNENSDQIQAQTQTQLQHLMQVLPQQQQQLQPQSEAQQFETSPSELQQIQRKPQSIATSEQNGSSDLSSKSNPLLMKMFQNALFNNIISDQAIQILNEQLTKDAQLRFKFSHSLERIMDLSINQEQNDGYVKISPNGYISMMRILQCYVDDLTVQDLEEFRKLLRLSKMIYKQVQKPDDDKSLEYVSIWQGLTFHKKFNDISLFVQWGSAAIQDKLPLFQQQQDSHVLNEHIPSSESEFLVLELVNFLSMIQDMGCTQGTTQVIQDQLMELFRMNDQVREKITSQIEFTKDSRRLPQILLSTNVEEFNVLS